MCNLREAITSIVFLLTSIRISSIMIFKFRICQDDNAADTAQGWVVACSEIRARECVGAFAYLQVMQPMAWVGIPNDTIIVTDGKLSQPSTLSLT